MSHWRRPWLSKRSSSSPPVHASTREKRRGLEKDGQANGSEGKGTTQKRPLSTAAHSCAQPNPWAARRRAHLDDDELGQHGHLHAGGRRSRAIVVQVQLRICLVKEKLILSTDNQMIKMLAWNLCKTQPRVQQDSCGPSDDQDTSNRSEAFWKTPR